MCLISTTLRFPAILFGQVAILLLEHPEQKHGRVVRFIFRTRVDAVGTRVFLFFSTVEFFYSHLDVYNWRRLLLVPTLFHIRIICHHLSQALQTSAFCLLSRLFMDTMFSFLLPFESIFFFFFFIFTTRAAKPVSYQRSKKTGPSNTSHIYYKNVTYILSRSCSVFTLISSPFIAHMSQRLR